jgi:predicted nucleic acid-binding Zn ribbon protein
MAETERIPQHRHCSACGNAHLNSELFCGDACKDSKKAEIKKKKRQLMIIQLVAMAMMVIAIATALV